MSTMTAYSVLSSNIRCEEKFVLFAIADFGGGGWSGDLNPAMTGRLLAPDQIARKCGLSVARSKTLLLEFSVFGIIHQVSDGWIIYTRLAEHLYPPLEEIDA